MVLRARRSVHSSTGFEPLRGDTQALGGGRTHTWNERARRLIMHYDRLFAVSEAWAWLAEARTHARRQTA